MKLDVFGRILLVERSDGRWQVFDIGNEGKKRLARDIIIPQSVQETGIVEYLADILHENSTPKNFQVLIINE